LRPGQTVIMDNLAAHKVAGLQEAIEARGARLEYLPSYSPELSPIEKCWSKVKALIRAKAARTRDSLDQAITEALDRITAQDARGWFAHCGYVLYIQLGTALGTRDRGGDCISKGETKGVHIRCLPQLCYDRVQSGAHQWAEKRRRATLPEDSTHITLSKQSGLRLNDEAHGSDRHTSTR